MGIGSAIERSLAVRGFPTYVLVDQEGVILANGFGPLPRLQCMAERAVAGEVPYGCTPADWMSGFRRRGRAGRRDVGARSVPGAVYGKSAW